MSIEVSVCIWCCEPRVLSMLGKISPKKLDRIFPQPLLESYSSSASSEAALKTNGILISGHSWWGLIFIKICYRICVVYKTLGDIFMQQRKNWRNTTTEFKHLKGRHVEREVDLLLPFPKGWKRPAVGVTLRLISWDQTVWRQRWWLSLELYRLLQEPEVLVRP